MSSSSFTQLRRTSRPETRKHTGKLRRAASAHPRLLHLEDRLAPAAVWYVNDDPPGGSNTGLNWADAFTNLQMALQTAQPGDQIWVAEGRYTPTGGTNRSISFALKAGVSVYGGFAGTPGTEGDLSQRDWVTNVTTLSGDIGIVGDNSDNSYHVMESYGLDASATLDGFTITAGWANGAASSQDSGGGMYNDHSSPMVRNVIFIDVTQLGGRSRDESGRRGRRRG